MSQPNTAGLNLGDRAPELSLPDTEGASHALTGGGARVTVIVWTCNHCPYALAWHDRILAAARDYSGRDVRFLLVNSNDPVRYPRDSLEAMQQRVLADGGWPAPYLWDETQEAARAFGARVTPDVFVLDGEARLVYRGAPDADHGRPEENAAWLRAALDDLGSGVPVARPETEPVGCGVKWRTAA